MIRVQVLTIGRVQGSDDYLLVLREVDGERLLPITIGEFEARAIERAARGVVPARPGTHDLLAAVVQRLGGVLERAIIHDLRDETFFCQLELQGGRGLLEGDCRTSDAVALALRSDSPVYATEDVLHKAAVLPRQQVEEPAPEDADEDGSTESE